MIKPGEIEVQVKYFVIGVKGKAILVLINDCLEFQHQVLKFVDPLSGADQQVAKRLQESNSEISSKVLKPHFWFFNLFKVFRTAKL